MCVHVRPMWGLLRDKVQRGTEILTRYVRAAGVVQNLFQTICGQCHVVFVTISISILIHQIATTLRLSFMNVIAETW